MSSKALHDIKGILNRLEIMASLLDKKDFANFTEDEIRADIVQDLERLQQLFNNLSSDQSKSRAP